MMTNIPKKLPTNSQNYGSEVKLELVRIKVEEIISYLQAKEEASKEYENVCNGRHYHSFWRYSDKCIGCGKTLDELEEASKGECDVMCNECMPPKPMNDHKYLKGVIIHERTDCPPDTLYMINENLLDKVIPPEQENEFFKLIMEYKLSDFTHMAKMISKELKSEYISKEKIKEYVSDKLNCYSNTDYRVALKDLSESLGLGD